MAVAKGSKGSQLAVVKGSKLECRSTSALPEDSEVLLLRLSKALPSNTFKKSRKISVYCRATITEVAQ